MGLCCGYPIEGYQQGGVQPPGTTGGSATAPEGWRFAICGDRRRCVRDPIDGISQWYRAMWKARDIIFCFCFWGERVLCRRKRGKGKSGALAVGCRRLLPPAPRLPRHSRTHSSAHSNTFHAPHKRHPPKTSKAKDEAFRAQVAARWRELRAGPLSDAWVSDNLEGTAGRIREAALRNYARWGDALRWEAYGGGFADDGAQLSAEVAALGAWLRARLAWMDGQLSGGGGDGVAASDGA
jgi:hypothetical protein